MDSDHLDTIFEPDFSWIHEYHNKVFRIMSVPPTISKPPDPMPDINDFSRLLQTIENKVEYNIFRRNEFESTGTVDDSIITFCISTLEFIERMQEKEENSVLEEAFPLVSSHFGTDGVHDYVQIVARTNECSKSSFLTSLPRQRTTRWAETSQ
jgi:hypothetical protein